MSLRRTLHDLSFRAYERFLAPPAPNDVGNRHVEYSWIGAKMPRAGRPEAKALDFGSGNGWLGLLAARLGYEATAIDLRELHFDFLYEGFSFHPQDLLKEALPLDHYDLIINCSTIEHVGLKRYGNKKEDGTGDFQAMSTLLHSLKKDGLMLLTTTVGIGQVFPNSHRIYGEERLEYLLKGWEILEEEFWLKNDKNQWIPCRRPAAFQVKGNENYYALSLQVLKKASS